MIKYSHVKVEIKLKHISKSRNVKHVIQKSDNIGFDGFHITATFPSLFPADSKDAKCGFRVHTLKRALSFTLILSKTYSSRSSAPFYQPEHVNVKFSQYDKFPNTRYDEKHSNKRETPFYKTDT